MDQARHGHLIVYFSLGGGTAKVARWIEEVLRAEGQAVTVADLTFAGSPVYAPLPGTAQVDCLWVLSPIYAQHPAPADGDYLRSLPEGQGRLVAPVVTYGVVCSGMGLYEMASALLDKGYRLAGAAKVVSEHSMMWPYESPLGQGRPDQDDAQAVRGLARRVAGAVASPGDLQALTLADLDYQPQAVREAAAQRNVHMLRTELPLMGLDQERCDECGLCRMNCCTHNISLSPKPVFGDRCIYCLNCLRVCPQQALSNPLLGGLDKFLRERAAFFNEPALTRVF